MAQRIIIEKRVTHKYVGKWRHLDQWRDAISAPARALPRRLVAVPGGDADHSEGPTHVHRFRLPAGLTRRQRDDAARGLRDMYTSHGCSHEYDCCGCSSHYARVIHRAGRDVVLAVGTSYNY